MRHITQLLFTTLICLCISVAAQAQACDCVCSGSTGLPDPLPIPPGMGTPTNQTECTDACTAIMYASGTYVGFLNLCTCSGAPADPPDPTDPIEAPDAATCTQVCDALNYTTNVCTPVPVELVHFDAIAQHEQIMLQWQTASEIDNAGFEVERSKDGTTWQLLDFVKGYGTTIELQQYKWVDDAPLEGISYYRLRQVDYAGTFEYSKIISVALDGDKQRDILAWPNPATEHLHFQLTQEDTYDGAVIQLYNNTGILVKTVRPDSFNTRLNQGAIFIGDLPNGFYLLRLQQGRFLMSKSFIKQ